MAEVLAARENSVGAALAAAEGILRASRDALDPREEARTLLVALLDVQRSWPSRHMDDELSPPDVAALLDAARRRAAGAPPQYATGRAAFRHLVLRVDSRVLIPRPETELLVDLALECANGGTVVDVGTGSGCIALSLASEGRFDRVIATDLSRDALDVAGGNAARLGALLRTPVELRHGSLLAPLRGERVEMIVSNPPYIADAEAAELPALVRNWEPALALFSGDGGMAHIAALARESAESLVDGGWLLLEVDSRRAARAADSLRATGCYDAIAIRRDLAGRDRFVMARRRGRAARAAD